MSATAKLFKHGRSQAVRLPKEFRFEGTEVRVSKVGDKVVLEPIEKQPFDATVNLLQFFLNPLLEHIPLYGGVYSKPVVLKPKAACHFR